MNPIQQLIASLAAKVFDAAREVVEGKNPPRSQNDAKNAADRSVRQKFGNQPSEVQDILRQMMVMMIAAIAKSAKADSDRVKILRDTQTKIFQMTQDITLNKAKAATKAAEKADEYLRS